MGMVNADTLKPSASYRFFRVSGTFCTHPMDLQGQISSCNAVLPFLLFTHGIFCSHPMI